MCVSLKSQKPTLKLTEKTVFKNDLIIRKTKRNNHRNEKPTNYQKIINKRKSNRNNNNNNNMGGFNVYVFLWPFIIRLMEFFSN